VTDRSFFHFLRSSLGLLERDLPSGYAVVCARLGKREVAVDVDGEASSLSCDGRRVVVLEAPRTPVARAVSTRAALTDLLAARTTLLDAALADRVLLVGALSDLIAFHGALVAYFSAAVRCPSFPALLEDFMGGSR
jgi:hypothetical protein